MLSSVFLVYLLEVICRKKLKQKPILGRFLLIAACAIQLALSSVGSKVGRDLRLSADLIRWTAIVSMISVALYCIIFCYHLLIKCFKYIDLKTKHESSIDKSVRYHFIGIIIALLMMPQLLFSVIYLVASEFVQNSVNLNSASLMDFYYYPFAIAFSLPVGGDSWMSAFQDIVSTNGLLQIIQVVHMLVTRVIEIITIGYIVEKLYIVFRRGK